MAFRLVFDLDLTGAKDFQSLAQLGVVAACIRWGILS